MAIRKSNEIRKANEFSDPAKVKRRAWSMFSKASPESIHGYDTPRDSVRPSRSSGTSYSSPPDSSGFITGMIIGGMFD